MQTPAASAKRTRSTKATTRTLALEHYVSLLKRDWDSPPEEKKKQHRTVFKPLEPWHRRVDEGDTEDRVIGGIDARRRGVFEDEHVTSDYGWVSLDRNRVLALSRMLIRIGAARSRGAGAVVQPVPPSELPEAAVRALLDDDFFAFFIILAVITA